MTSDAADSKRSGESYGQAGLTWVDNAGVYLSRRAILKHMPKGRDLSILELGCGFRAGLLLALRPWASKLTGVDFRIEPALMQSGIGDFHECPLDRYLSGAQADEHDVILLISVLEHLWKPLWHLEQIHRMLKPGGVVMINVPTWRGKSFLEFSAFRMGLSPRTEMDDHKMYYDLRDLWPLLVEAGFVPSRITLYYHKFGLNLFGVAKK